MDFNILYIPLNSTKLFLTGLQRIILTTSFDGLFDGLLTKGSSIHPECRYCNMPLTQTAVKNAKRRDKPYKISDSGGLYLLVKPSGYSSWKYDYRLNGKRGTYTIGEYPDISLKLARDMHREAREHVAQLPFKNSEPSLWTPQVASQSKLEVCFPLQSGQFSA